MKYRYTDLQNAPQQIARAQNVIKNIDNGTVATGPTVGLGQTAGAVLANLGSASDKELTQIRNTSDAQALTAMVSAQIAKANNPGGRITDSDQKLAEGIVGAGTAGNPAAMKDAINRYIGDKQNDVALYNSDADNHMAELDRAGIRSGLLRVRKIGGDPGNAPSLGYVNASTAPTNSLAQPGTVDQANAAPVTALSLLPGSAAKAVPAAPAAPSVPAAAVNYLRANPGLKADFDRKYGTGAAASILGK